jgi:hypothetical protein
MTATARRLLVIVARSCSRRRRSRPPRTRPASRRSTSSSSGSRVPTRRERPPSTTRSASSRPAPATPRTSSSSCPGPPRARPTSNHRRRTSCGHRRAGRVWAIERRENFLEGHAFARGWGMNVAVQDMRRVVEQAKKQGGKGLRAAQAHLDQLKESGDPRGWDGAGALTPITRYAEMFSGWGSRAVMAPPGTTRSA